MRAKYVSHLDSCVVSASSSQGPREHAQEGDVRMGSQLSSSQSMYHRVILLSQTRVGKQNTLIVATFDSRKAPTDRRTSVPQIIQHSLDSYRSTEGELPTLDETSRHRKLL